MIATTLMPRSYSSLVERLFGGPSLSLLGMLAACSPWAPPAIAPATPIPTPPALWPPDPRLAVAPPRVSTATQSQPTPSTPHKATPHKATSNEQSPAANAATKPLRVRVQFEPAYPLGEQPLPSDRQAYVEQMRQWRRWNDGGLGTLVGALPGLEGHPDPRVIVNIADDDVSGMHEASELQRYARKHQWMRIVRCYRLGAYKDPHLRGWTSAAVQITRSGRVIKPKLIESELKDAEVRDCLVERLTELRFARIRKRAPTVVTRAVVRMRVAPGDEPMPPPAERIVRGEGKLSSQAMLAPIRGARSAIEGCYRSAFEYAPGLWGRIVLRVHVDPRGKVLGVFEGGSRFPDKRVVQCVLRVVRDLRFDAPDGGELRFTVPVRLSSSKAKLPKQLLTP